jgi:glutathione synthase/RimK-type ligase-like ATP-grasp enzyme
MISSQKVSIISNDKYENFLFLKKHQPKTYLLKTFFYEHKKIHLYSKIVIKPIRASWGKWIELTTTEELMKNRDKFIGLEELFIVQEFKDFSKGYPWIVDWNHDIRLMFAGKNIIETTLRIPEKWNFKSNIWSWWTQSTLSKKLLPKELLNLSKKIYKELDLQWDDILSMDFAYCTIEKKRYLIEINAYPGTRYYQTDQKSLLDTCLWLVKFFKQIKRSLSLT